MGYRCGIRLRCGGIRLRPNLLHTHHVIIAVFDFAVAVFGFALIFCGITSVEHQFPVSPAASGQVSWNVSSDSNVSVPSRVSGVSGLSNVSAVKPPKVGNRALLVKLRGNTCKYALRVRSDSQTSFQSVSRTFGARSGSR